MEALTIFFECRLVRQFLRTLYKREREQSLKGARALTPLEIQAVCAAFDGKYTIRNRALFLVCSNIGARITEALNLNVGDVLQNGAVVEVLYLRRAAVKGKRSGVALALPVGARKTVRNYLSWKRQAREPLRRDAPLFASRKGGGLTRQQAHNSSKRRTGKWG